MVIVMVTDVCAPSDALGTVKIEIKSCQGPRRPTAKPDMEVVLRTAATAAQT